MGKRKHPPVSIHQTLNGTLQVNWEKEYSDNFTCPICNQGHLKYFCYYKNTECQLQLGCDFCHKYTPLSCQTKKYPSVSIHQTLQETLQVNWLQSYSGEFICPKCNQGKIKKFDYSEKLLCKLRVKCDLCNQTTNLTCDLPKHPQVSIHETLNGSLQVNWTRDYSGEFICPECNQASLNRFSYSSGAKCKLRLGCDRCSNVTYLTCKFSPYLPISRHPTLNGNVSVNWSEKYQGTCVPNVIQELERKFYYSKSLNFQVKLVCNSCQKVTLLGCQVPPHIHSYRSDLVCPNPLCHQIGYHGQKGWIYETFQTNSCQSNCRCYFCQINFDPSGEKQE